MRVAPIRTERRFFGLWLDSELFGIVRNSSEQLSFLNKKSRAKQTAKPVRVWADRFYRRHVTRGYIMGGDPSLGLDIK